MIVFLKKDTSPLSPEAMEAPKEAVRVHIIVSGVVQKVGFRVFAQNLALEHELAGYVRNHRDSVEIEAQGLSSAIDSFINDLKYKAPRAAIIKSVDVNYIDALTDFSDHPGIFKILNTKHE
jgi:acylphosphatase